MVSLKHKEVLLKSLQTSQVSKDTTPEQLTNLVAAVRASTALSFSDQDLTLERKNHSKPLLVTMLCNQKKVPSVLVDNGSALNICPLSTTTAIGFCPNDFTPSYQGIMAYDNSRRDVVGNLSTTIFMADETFDVEFQVLDIKSSFNLLLGRPWLHTVGVVPSSLHQKLKFMKGSRVITVRGDEDLEVGAILSDPHGNSA
ncbi:uncharacterized protein LOC143891101 [Tasmannia lanceolata]|uniref:uncharacterized protein LOC143891101 n=1 Tax=Tasmannia lanceolata TaxID=3420 RepID=UPI004064BE36